MFSEEDALIHSHDVVRVTRVLFHQELEKFRLLLGKLVVDLGVSVDFYRNMESSLVIDAADHLGKATFTENLRDFKSIEEMLSNIDNEVTFFIVAFLLALRWAADNSICDPTSKVDHLLALLAWLSVLELFLFVVRENMSVDLNESLLLHGIF